MSFLDSLPASRRDLAEMEKRIMSAFSNLIGATQTSIKDVAAIVKDSATVLQKLADGSSDFDPVAAQAAADQLNAANLSLEQVDAQLQAALVPPAGGNPAIPPK